MDRRRRRAAAWGLATLLLVGVAGAEPARADTVEARAAPHDGYGRIVFEWPEHADVSSVLDGDRLTLRFTRPISVRLASVQAALGARYVAAATQGADPDSVVLTLKRPVTVKTWHSGNNLVVDLVDRVEPAPAPKAPAPSTPGTPAPPVPATSPAQAAAAPAGAGPLVPVHANVTDGRDRLTFDWPTPTGVTWHRSGDVVTLRFDRPGRADFADVDRSEPCIIEKLDQQADTGAMLVNVTIPKAARIRTFRVGPRTVVDVLGPKTCRPWVPTTPAPAAAPPAAPAPTANQGAAPPPAVPPAPTTAAPAPPQPSGPPPIPTLVFDPGEPSGAAVYARAGYLYVVFDRALAHAAQTVQNPVPPNVRVTPVAGAPVTAFQIVPPPLLKPVLSQQGTSWRIRFVEAPPAESAGITVQAQPDYALGGRLLAPVSDARQVVPFTDPTVGDRIEVVPLAGPGEHIDPGRQFAPLDLPATLQGVVIVPHADSVAVRLVHDGIEMTMPGGVPLSSASDTAAARPPAVAAGPSLLDVPAWIRPGKTFIDVRQDLERRAAMTPLPMRQNARFELARFFLARGDGQEALGLMDLIGGDDPDLVDRPEFRALRGAARILAGRPQEGLGDLAALGKAGDPTISLWRGWAKAEQRDWPAAAKDFATAATIIDSYPDPLFSRVAPLAAEAALRAGQPLMVTDLIGRMRQHAGKTALPAADYLEAVLDQATGHPDAALPLYRKVADSLDQYWSTRAELAFVDLALERNLLTPAQAADTLDRLSYAWRGDWLETAILRKLGETDMLAGRYADALDALRHAEARDPKDPEDKAIHAELVDDFTKLFDPSMNGKVAPVDAVTIFQQNRDLVPAGPMGDKVIGSLAERLVGLDLLGQAADLLNEDVTRRLHGTDKAAVGARLAAIRLLDQKPQAALDALGASDQPGLPADLVERRTLLKARALADLNKGDAALTLLGQDQSHPADQLRADIAWRAKNWLLAAAALDRLIGSPPAAGTALSPETEKLVLNRAVALSLAGDVTSIATLREQFGAAMAKTPDANAFKVLTDPTTAAGGLNLASVPGLVAGVDLFKSFLDSYRAGSGGAPATQ